MKGIGTRILALALCLGIGGTCLAAEEKAPYRLSREPVWLAGIVALEPGPAERPNVTAVYRYRTVSLVPLGTTINFDRPVDRYRYRESCEGLWNETFQEGQTNWRAAPERLDRVTEDTVRDSREIYLFDTGTEQYFFKGVEMTPAPRKVVDEFFNWSDVQGAVRLSKPVARCVGHKDLTYLKWNYESGGYEERTSSFPVYTVPRGTVVEQGDYPYLYCFDGTGRQRNTGELIQQGFGGHPGEVHYPLTLDQPGECYVLGFGGGDGAAGGVKFLVEDVADYVPRSAQFDDLEGHWSRPFAEKAWGWQLMDGVGGGNFDPDGQFTVAQAITLAARLHADRANDLIPLSEGPWYQAYYNYCVKHRIISDKAFSPEHLQQPAARREMVMILSGNVSGNVYQKINRIENGFIPDVDRDSGQTNGLIYKWYESGFLSGGPDHSFRPNDPITRGEVAAILCRLTGVEDPIRF